MKTKEQLANMNATLEDLFEGYVSLTLHSARTAVQPVTTVSARASDAAATTISAVGSGGDSAATPIPVSTTSSHLPSDAVLPPINISLPLQLRLPSPSLPSVVDGDCTFPQYFLSRTISTVPQLWREWTVGLQ